ncbi:radical SAM protein [Candidatus Magnetomorum sp. HK-1]|nr:radical SAM protein [Candidatus Magnetomorum sp. HK-1]
MNDLNSNEQMNYYFRDEIYIETTNHCNIKCHFCNNPRLQNPRGMMSLELFKKTVDDIREHPKVNTIDLVGIGETFINPNVFKMIDYAFDNGLAIYACSNGKWSVKKDSLLSILKVRHIHVTLDGVTNDVYNLSRPNTDVNLIINNLKKIINLKKEMNSKTPHVEVKMVVFKFNKHQIIDIIKLAINIGADSVWIAKGGAPSQYQTDLSIEEWKHIKTLFPDFEINSSGFESSEMPFESFKRNRWKYEGYEKNKCLLDLMGCAGVTVRWDGSMSACCQDFGVTSILGNISNDSLLKLWSKNNIKRFENNLLNNHIQRVRTNQKIVCDNCPSFTNHIARSYETFHSVNNIDINIDFLLNQIENYIRSNNFKDASNLCNEVLQKSPDNASALYFLGIIEFKIGNKENSVILLTKAVSKLSSKSSFFHKQLGFILKDIGKTKLAEYVLKKSVNLHQYAEQLK